MALAVLATLATKMYETVVGTAEADGLEQAANVEAQEDASHGALPLIAQPQKRKRDWGKTGHSDSEGGTRGEGESGTEEYEEGWLDDLREQGRRKRASVVLFEDEPDLNEDEEEEEEEEEEAEMRLAEQALASRLKGTVKCRLGLGRERMAFEVLPTTFPTYDVVRQALSQCEETVVWVGVPQGALASVLQRGFEGTGWDCVTVYHDPAAAHSAYMRTLGPAFLSTTDIPSSALLPSAEPPSSLPPMVALGPLVPSVQPRPAGPEVVLLGCLLLWAPDSHMVVQDLEAGKVKVPRSGFVLLRPKYSATYNSTAVAQDSTEDQKFGFTDWELLNGNLTHEHVISQFKVELDTAELPASAT